MQVFDYVAGKERWLASGLPIEGKAARTLRAKDCLRGDIPTCRPVECLGEVRGRVQASGYDMCMVVNDAGIVFGSLSGAALAADAKMPAQQAMEPGPSTIRPHLLLRDVLQYLQQKDRDRIVVTTAEGRLMGLLYRQDAVQKLGKSTNSAGSTVRPNDPGQPSRTR